MCIYPINCVTDQYFHPHKDTGKPMNLRADLSKTLFEVSVNNSNLTFLTFLYKIGIEAFKRFSAKIKLSGN